jgi:PiT family inorganic phosphate transporter
MLLWIVLSVIALALIFDFYNGMNDAANSIATIVSTRVLTPKQAVVWAAFWNFAAAFLFGTAVAKTIGGKVVTLEVNATAFLIATAVGAIGWTHVCTKLGIPISVSHALVGALVGAGFVHGGFDPAVLKWGGIGKIVAFIFIAPIVGMIGGSLLMFSVYWIFRKATPGKVDRTFRVGQLFSAAAFSLGHGANDAQKTMALIVLAMLAGGYMDYQFAADGARIMPEVPMWIVLSAHAAIALGTMLGGWRVIRTMGSRLTKLRPVQGFCAETSGALVLFGATSFGIPISTTHSVSGSIMGAGTVQRHTAVRWGVARKMLVAWVITIPSAAIVSGAVYGLLKITGFVAWSADLEAAARAAKAAAGG